jgi:type III pantothenate kinase
MHLLAVDIGNSNINLGLFDGPALRASRRATTRVSSTSDELAVQVSGLLALDGLSWTDVGSSALASVVPPLTEPFAAMLEQHTGMPPTIIDAAALQGIMHIDIDRPAEAGADRLANALAAGADYGGPAIVVDLGTSTNFDVVDVGGAYIGGAIAPGLALSLEALVGSASKLPRIELRRPERAIGSNTISAMQSGTVNGYVGLVSGLLAALRGELAERSPAGARVTVIATGGLASEPWLEGVPGIDHVDPTLTLRGIRLAAERIGARTAAEVAR